MKWDEPRGLRQSMRWLHTWSGLVPGWLLFAVFLTGTLAFFRQEITFWMQPELHTASAATIDYAAISRALEAHAPGAAQWTISLPGARQPVVSLNWQNAGERFSRTPKLLLDPATGQVLSPRATVGGNFLYRFHYELYGMNPILGRWIVGIATMLMMVALLSGIIVHKKIFTDFFTFRPGKGKRSWMDGHILASVASLPFHLVITFSGLVLLGFWLLPTAYPDGLDKGRQNPQRAAPEKALISGLPAPQVNLGMLVSAAETSWGGAPAGTLTVKNPGTPVAVVEIRARYTSAVAEGRNAAPVARFSGTTGEALPDPASASASVMQRVSSVLMAVHRGFYALPWVRWLLFLGGVLGSLMIATGLALWVEARKKKAPSRGVRLAEILNVGAVAGLILAVAAQFWANRLVPADWASRSAWEIGVFFVVWGLSFAYATWRPGLLAWRQTLAAAGLALALLPLGNLPYVFLYESLTTGRWLVAGFDLTALAAGGLLLWTARKIGRKN
ncbi:MAG: PepSY domain-containing protein, partial [Zoogloeaceae bacterium]|nr:PepSY domain-containing protein [Zoogloeaceae bacterium]